MRIRQVEVGGETALSVAEAGVEGRPLMLLHGFAGACEDFSEWLDPLATLGWHAVAPDHRGHGASHQPPDESAYSLDAFADDAFGLADALGWDQFVTLGHSMGGMVAQVMALRSPERVSGLVLMDTHHRGVDVDQTLLFLAVTVAKAEGMAALADAMDAIGRDTPDASPFGSAADARVKAERPGYAESGRRKLLASAPAMYAAMAPAMTAHADTPDRLDQLGAISVPTLVIVGEEDRSFLKASERIAGVIPGAELVVIEDAGHSPQFENPDVWWEALTEWLGRHW